MGNPEFSTFEDAPYREPLPSEVTKGEHVGGITPQKNGLIDSSDLDSKKEQEKGLEKNTIPKLSIDELQKLVNSGKKELGEFLQINPDALATKEKGPEAIKQAGLEVREKGWPC